ncbi:MAG: hypothetical protein WBD20_08030 [Pirellulaceae bacterium]
MAREKERRFSAQGLTLCIGVFFLIDLLLLRRAWILDHNQMAAITGLPVAQVSLVSLWAALSSRNIALRVIVVGLSGGLGLLLLSRILPWQISHPDAVFWAWAIVVQSILTNSFVIVARRYFQRKNLPLEKLPPIFQFKLNTLVLCTVVAAGLFTVAGYGVRNFGWHFRADDLFGFGLTTVLATMYAISATICWWILTATSRTRVLARLCVGLAVMLAVVAICFVSITSLFLEPIGWQTMSLLGLVPFFVVLSAGAVCQGRWLGRPATVSAAETTPGSTETSADQIVLGAAETKTHTAPVQSSTPTASGGV